MKYFLLAETGVGSCFSCPQTGYVHALAVQGMWQQQPSPPLTVPVPDKWWWWSSLMVRWALHLLMAHLRNTQCPLGWCPEGFSVVLLVSDCPEGLIMVMLVSECLEGFLMAKTL